MGFRDKLKYILSTLILFFSCTPLPEGVPGCMDSNACNFNPDANEDDGSCIPEPDMCGTCDNDSTNNCIKDCIGEPCIEGESGCLIGTGVIEDDGTQIGTDGCGVCGGNNSSCTDCADVLNGPNIADMCGTCDSDSSNDCVQDCIGAFCIAGESGCLIGTGVIEDDGTQIGTDECGICGGNNSSCTDCADVPNGPNLADMCGTCDSDPSNDCKKDCAGVWGGNTTEEECQACVSGVFDCAGACDGTCVECDCVFECGGGDWSCADCLGVPNGPNITDYCGTCDNDPSNDCSLDCSGEWGGTAVIDECGVCNGPCTELVSAEGECIYCDGSNDGACDTCVDCAGYADGLNITDMCDTCDNDPSNDCIMDCMAVWGGTAVRDDCGICDNDFSNDCVLGCMDSNACNYDETADVDDGSCGYEYDCAGVCGGSNLIDCLDICGGGAYMDPCGYCDADPDNDCLLECSEILSELSIDDVIYECDQTETVNGYFCNDLQVIQIIINNNPGSIHIGMDADANNIISALEYGDQLWLNGRLVSLDLTYNENVVMPTFCNFKLDTIPEIIGELDALKTLNLKNNEITTLPEEIGDLDNLEKLILESNRLTTFPESIGNLEKLEILYAHHNQITSLPSSFVELTNLQVLWLHFNNISFLPVNLGNMINLETLWLHNNQIEEIPSSIGELESLVEINLDNNQLNTLPDNICNLGVDINGGLIINLSISNNETCPIYPACVDIILGYQDCEDYCESGYLIGDGSAGEDGMDSECLNFGDWQVLQDIIDNNDVYAGKKPIEIVHNSHWERSAEDNRLIELILDIEELNGQIPLSIGNLDSLKILRMEGNHLTGIIPETIGNLTVLREIKLNSNNLTGNIPPSITNLKNLTLMLLYNNNLSGDIPIDIGELGKLKEIQLQYNTLTGSIPESIGDLSNLKWLYLRDNKLSGEIPTSIGGLISLKRLKLINNDLSGQIPESICSIYDINENLRLYLDNNQLCPGPSGYPECIPEFHIGSQECSD